MHKLLHKHYLLILQCENKVRLVKQTIYVNKISVIRTSIKAAVQPGTNFPFDIQLQNVNNLKKKVNKTEQKV